MAKKLYTSKKTIRVGGSEYYQKILNEELDNLMDEKAKADQLSYQDIDDKTYEEAMAKAYAEKIKAEKSSYSNDIRIEKYRSYLQRSGGLNAQLRAFDEMSQEQKLHLLDSLHPSFVSKIMAHPKPKGYKPKYETRQYKTYDHKTGREMWHQETVLIGHQDEDVAEDCDCDIIDELPNDNILPISSEIDKSKPHPIRVKNPLTTGIMYSFRFPLSDGSFLFYSINDDNGLYVNDRDEDDVKSIDQLLRMLNSPHKISNNISSQITPKLK